MTDFKVTKEIDADTLIRVVLDKSGSMGGKVRHDTIGGFNEYLAELKAKNPGRTLFSLYQFDSTGITTNLERTVDNIDLNDVPELTLETYQPRGGTPLYDAVGQVIIQTEEEIKASQNKPNVLLVIITDGGNTDGHGYQDADVRGMIKRVEESKTWTVAYLGANQDAWEVGQTMGLAQGNTMNYTTESMRKTMRSMAAASATYAATSTRMKSMDPQSFYETQAFYSDAGLKEDDFK